MRACCLSFVGVVTGVLVLASTGESRASGPPRDEAPRRRLAAIDVRPVRLSGTWDGATGALVAQHAVTQPGDGLGPNESVVFDNTTLNGSGYLPGPGVVTMDWGTLGGTELNRLTAFQFAYFTTSPPPVQIGVRFHVGATGGGASGTVAAWYLITGLPGADPGQGTASYAVEVELEENDHVTLPEGPIGYSFEVFDANTGLLLVGPPVELGVVDELDEYTDQLAYVGSFDFGGNPFASLYMKITALEPSGIIVDFTPDWRNDAHWANDAALRVRAEKVVLTARDHWMAAVPGLHAEVITLSMDWGVPVAFFEDQPNVCGVGGVQTTHLVGPTLDEWPATTRIILNRFTLGDPPGQDDDTWFIDPSPAKNEEYKVFKGEPWRAKAFKHDFHPGVPSGKSSKRIDMLAWTKHEIGHTLGFHYDPPLVFTPYVDTVNPVVGIPGFVPSPYGAAFFPVGKPPSLNAISHLAPGKNINVNVGGQPAKVATSHLLMIPAFPDFYTRTFMSPYEVSMIGSLLATATAIPLPKAPAGVERLVITEYARAGAGGAWIEITNDDTIAADLTGWSLSDASRGPGAVDLSALGVLDPGESVVVCAASAAAFAADWGLSGSVGVLGGAALALDADDQITLYDDEDSLADQLDYGRGAFPGTIDTAGASGFAAEHRAVGNNEIASWILSFPGDGQGSTTSLGGDLGSPGSYEPDNGWTDLHDALEGTHGLPRLDGAGLLVGGNPITVTLSNTLENSTVYLVVGLAALNLSFKGGVLVPDVNPPGFFVALPTGPFGTLPLGGAWPIGLPSGLTTYFQAWVVDPAGPLGFAASNALSATTP